MLTKGYVGGGVSEKLRLEQLTPARLDDQLSLQDEALDEFSNVNKILAGEPPSRPSRPRRMTETQHQLSKRASPCRLSGRLSLLD